jgi:hypothetical protein
MVTELHWVCGIWSFLSSQVMIIVWMFYRLSSALAEPDRFRRRQMLSLYFKMHSHWYNIKTIASLYLIWNAECGRKCMVSPHSAYHRGKLALQDFCSLYGRPTPDRPTYRNEFFAFFRELFGLRKDNNPTCNWSLTKIQFSNVYQE